MKAGKGAPNEIWVMDILSGQLFDGTRIRVLTIVDICSQISPAIDVRRSYRGANVVETLERVVARSGLPRQIRLDTGPEFISRDPDLLAYAEGVVLGGERICGACDNKGSAWWGVSIGGFRNRRSCVTEVRHWTNSEGNKLLPSEVKLIE